MQLIGFIGASVASLVPEILFRSAASPARPRSVAPALTRPPHPRAVRHITPPGRGLSDQ